MLVKSILLFSSRLLYQQVIFMYQYKYGRLRDMREDNDLTQAQVAEVLGIDQRVYSNYETGKREIPTRFIVALAKFYGTSADYILGLTDNPKS